MLGIIRTFLICKPLLVLSVDEVVEDAMDWTCGKYGEEEKTYVFWWGKVLIMPSIKLTLI